jgi:IMP cyclohydrolase
LLKNNEYPGRGIIIGRSPDGDKAVAAYFITGRSENSRNRIFVPNGLGGIKTEAFVPRDLTDPSLVIYNAVRTIGRKTIVSNGDQTDTICERLNGGADFEEALREREFEPDAPHYTPRVSGLIEPAGGGFSYTLSILKTDCGDPRSCLRHTFRCDNPEPGAGRFIHTYKREEEPLPSFEGEPLKVEIPDDIDGFTASIWEALNADNRISLFVRYISIADNTFEDRIVNKNRGSKKAAGEVSR